MREYWNKRYYEGDKIWGIHPSKTAKYALDLFQKQNLHKILIPGMGYGRNSKLFSDNDFKVCGIEISPNATELARCFDTKTTIIMNDVLNMPFSPDIFDGIYCYNLLHLFFEKERKIFIRNCYSQLKPNGFIYMSVFSEKEKSFGKGKKLEINTFESKPGRPTHYFSKRDLLDHFKDFKNLEIGFVEEKENHGKVGEHTHLLRYILAQKVI